MQNMHIPFFRIQNMQNNMQNMQKKYGTNMQIMKNNMWSQFQVYIILTCAYSAFLLKICTPHSADVEPCVFLVTFIAPRNPTRRLQSCYAQTTRVPAPPIPSEWGGLIYGIIWIPRSSRAWSPLLKGPGGVSVCWLLMGPRRSIYHAKTWYM